MSSSAPTPGPRFAVLKPEQLNEAQKKTLKSILSGPRAAGDPGAADRLLQGGPFNVWLRSPELGDHLQKVGSYIRFKSTLGMRLNELAILVTARHWTSQYEWFAHHRLAPDLPGGAHRARTIQSHRRSGRAPERVATIG